VRAGAIGRQVLREERSLERDEESRECASDHETDRLRAARRRASLVLGFAVGTLRESPQDPPGDQSRGESDAREQEALVDDERRDAAERGESDRGRTALEARDERHGGQEEHERCVDPVDPDRMEAGGDAREQRETCEAERRGPERHGAARDETTRRAGEPDRGRDGDEDPEEQRRPAAGAARPSRQEGEMPRVRERRGRERTTREIARRGGAGHRVVDRPLPVTGTRS
jgi:hypothetical protein